VLQNSAAPELRPSNATAAPALGPHADQCPFVGQSVAKCGQSVAKCDARKGRMNTTMAATGEPRTDSGAAATELRKFDHDQHKTALTPQG
jgi:hypothetical protein